MNRPTVSKKWLQHEAESIEQSAKESVAAWIALGQTELFDAAMAKARYLRMLARVNDLHERREALRSIGYNV